MSTGQREPQENDNRRGRNKIGRQQHDAPVGAIGDVAGGEHEQHERDKLRQADESEVEGIARDGVYLPAHSDIQHRPAQGSEEPSRCVDRIIAIAQGGERF